MPHAHVSLLEGPFTVDDFYRMAEVGLLDPEARVELLDGQVVEMSPIGARHATCVNQLTMLLARRVPEGVTVSVQNPVIAGRKSVPQPDVALLRIMGGEPKLPDRDTTLLVIEVADTTLLKDREIKLPIYARAGIAEVWLVDLRRGAIAVYTLPQSDGYAGERTVRPGDALAPAALPEIVLAVTDILVAG